MRYVRSFCFALTTLAFFLPVLSPAFTSSIRPNASPPVWPTRSRIISG